MEGIISHTTESILDQFPIAQSLTQYRDALFEENSRVNLVSRETEEKDFRRICAESLLPFLGSDRTFENYLDIGSGGGFPSIPIRLAFPSIKKMVLVERTQKKAVALERIVEQLGLKAEIHSQTFEDLKLAGAFDLITIRYVTLDRPLLKKVVPHLSPHGILVYYSSPKSRDSVGLVSETREFMLDDPQVVKHYTTYTRPHAD